MSRTETAPTEVPEPAVRVRFDRNELSGAFGDIGTDLPLIIGMILAAGLDPASVLIMFGLMQVTTGLIYGMPMPAQPLKAMAALVISQKLAGDVLYGGGLAVGLIMLLLAATGLIDWLAKAVPKVVVRGVQFGLGLQLAMLALKDYLPAEGLAGYGLGAAAFVLVILLLGNRRFPPAPFVMVLGFLFAIAWRADPRILAHGIGFALPHFRVPAAADVWTGFLLLALPQIPLSLGNSILATKQITADLFPERKVSVRKISFTYAGMNLINPFFGGVPTCHGSGGMAGHYTFGGRTGGSVILYGALFLILGLFLSGSFLEVIKFFPRPVLAVILLFEALALLRLARDMTASAADFTVVMLVGLLAITVPYGYLTGMIVGIVLVFLIRRGTTNMV